jgi:hypothetical protein
VENELVKYQLGIDFGLVIKEVIDDSPAKKAGLKQYDIMVKVGDAKLDSLKMLGQRVGEAKESELQLTVIRNGKQQTFGLTPAKRPKKYKAALRTPVELDDKAAAEWEMLQDTLRALKVPHEEDDDDKDITSLFYIMPGFVLPSEAKDFPKDLEVSVTKKGKQPAKIVVKRGDDQWEVDESSLDELPEDIRPHIKRMVGKGLKIGVGKTWFNAKPFRPLMVDPKSQLKIPKFQFTVPDKVRKNFEDQLKRLDEAHRKIERSGKELSGEVLEQLRRELKELRKELEKMRAQQHHDKAEQKRDDQDDDSEDEEDDLTITIVGVTTVV